MCGNGLTSSGSDSVSSAAGYTRIFGFPYRKCKIFDCCRTRRNASNEQNPILCTFKVVWYFSWNRTQDKKTLRNLKYKNIHVSLKDNNYNLPDTYVVWQKSNETDFLLTMNFIIFTNQGCPLQNSSLGQLHINGGVVSIVRSSAGRLLLVYLSARRLRSSGYYPKNQNGCLSSGCCFIMQVIYCSLYPVNFLPPWSKYFP